MAKVLSTVASALTIAALFKTCLDAFELISAAKHTDLNLQKLAPKLTIEKCRLYTMGESLVPYNSGWKLPSFTRGCTV